MVDYLELQVGDMGETDHRYFWKHLGKEELSNVYYLSN
jgi:hypothetical protein